MGQTKEGCFGCSQFCSTCSKETLTHQTTRSKTGNTWKRPTVVGGLGEGQGEVMGEG